MIIRKKYKTIAAAVKEIEALEEQVIVNANTVNALRRELKNHPAQHELDKMKSKWYVKLFYRGK